MYTFYEPPLEFSDRQLEEMEKEATERHDKATEYVANYGFIDFPDAILAMRSELAALREIVSAAEFSVYNCCPLCHMEKPNHADWCEYTTACKNGWLKDGE